MSETIVQPVLEVTIVNEDGSTTVISKDENKIVQVLDNNSIIVQDNKDVVILSSGLQGPPGPPTGISTEIADLNFIGLGTGSTKTTTRTIGNLIFEEFDINDEVFTYFTFPHGFDKSKDAQFYGVWFPLSDDGPGYTSSWEIHVTTHNHLTQDSVTGMIPVTDLPVPATAYYMTEGYVTISHLTYDFANSNDMHIRLKRVTSTSNPPNGMGIPVLNLIYNTDARVGEQGDTGPQGPPGGEEVALAKQIDWIDDEHVYIGEASPGSAVGSGLWRIKYVVFQTDGDTAITWADGTDEFTKVWNSRLSYSYS